jgi:hypothetical protein
MDFWMPLRADQPMLDDSVTVTALVVFLLSLFSLWNWAWASASVADPEEGSWPRRRDCSQRNAESQAQ